MSNLAILISLPVGNINKTHEVVQTTDTGSIKIFLMIMTDFLLSWDTYSVDVTSRNIEFLTIRVKELAWNVIFQRDNSSIGED